MGIMDLFGSRKKDAEEEAKRAEEQKQKNHERLVSEQREAHAALSWPEPLPLNGMKVKDAGSMGFEDPLTSERKEEVGSLVFEPKLSAGDVTGLTDDELLFLLYAHDVYNRAAPLENYEANHRVIYNELLSRIHSTAAFYVLYDAAAGYPLIDGGYICVYRNKEHAETAAKAYQKQFRKAAVLERPGEAAPEPDDPKKKPISFFDYLYYLGMENVVVDNGWYKAFIHRSEISAPPTSFMPDPAKVPPASPELAFAMCDFIEEARWQVKYEKREEVLKAKMARVNALVTKARFVVPVSAQAKQAESGEEGTDSAGKPGQTEVRVPMIRMKDAKGNVAGNGLIPIYTDFFEYSKSFQTTKDFHPVLFEFPKLLRFLAGADGLVINPKGQSIVIAKRSAEAMQGGNAQEPAKK